MQVTTCTPSFIEERVCRCHGIPLTVCPLSHASPGLPLTPLPPALPQVCNHPYMFQDAEPDFDGVSTNEEIVNGSGVVESEG